ncbi:MAG: class I adenylate-forming enzyme family protein [Campylobacterota bacterium]|nr:class I adenylate-forming enzyme family protein [Campylobacterota bacterium]
MKILNLDTNSYEVVRKIESPQTKIEQLLHLLYCYENSIYETLYDKNQPILKSYVQSLKEVKETNEQFLFFTSGTTGNPTGAFKTKENLELEVKELVDILSAYAIQRVVVTVPFVHLYGVNVGALLSKYLHVELVVKENFLLEELIEQAQKRDTLVVTTPLFIKALNRLKKDVEFKNALFITSTSPLQQSDAKEFKEHYNSTVMQIFGSTESGAIAYKFDDNKIWRAFKSVEISSKNEMLEVTSPFISRKLLNEKVQTVELPFKSEDIVNIVSEKEFILVGRDSSLIKIAGKRFSTLQIESIVESLPEVNSAIVKVKRDDKALKDEIVEIYIEQNEDFNHKKVRELFLKNFGSTHIPYKLHVVQKILFSSVGKKIGFE